MLLIGIIVITVHPFVDLEPTVLRLLQVSILFFGALALTAITRTVRSHTYCYLVRSDKADPLRKNSPSLIDLACARIC